MRQSVVNIWTILVLFSTLYDVLSLLNKGYSENGTIVKVNENYWLKIKSIVLLNNINSEPQHNAGYRSILVVNRLPPGIK